MLAAAGVAIAPSTFYAAKTRPPSARSLRDEQLKTEIKNRAISLLLRTASGRIVSIVANLEGDVSSHRVQP